MKPSQWFLRRSSAFFLTVNWLCIACVGVMVIGCSSGSTALTLAPADGTVTFMGTPLAGATIMFAPEKGAVAFAVTDLNGKFQMKTGGRNGVIVGPVTASITIPSSDDASVDPAIAKPPKTPEEAQAYMKKAGEMQAKMATTKPEKPKDLLPPKYSKTDTSGLSYTIKANGDNHFDISL